MSDGERLRRTAPAGPACRRGVDSAMGAVGDGADGGRAVDTDLLTGTSAGRRARTVVMWLRPWAPMCQNADQLGLCGRYTSSKTRVAKSSTVNGFSSNVSANSR